jgi:hypothetical protein
MKALCLIIIVIILAVAPHSGAQAAQTQSSQTPTQAASDTPAASQTTGPGAEATTQEAPIPKEYRPGIGTIIVAELSNALDAKRAKVGDRVECTVTQDLLFQGKIVVPRYAKVVGRVTETEAFTREHRESRIGISFEKVLLKDKKELLFQSAAIVVALAPPVKQIVKTATDIRDLPVQMQNNGGASPGMGSSTGGSVLGSIASNPDLVGANMASTTGVISGSNRGVISWPGLYLLKGPPGSSIIASPKGNVQLGFQSQMVLRVTEPGN